MRRKGSGFIDVLASIALLLICSMLLSAGLNSYYKNLQLIKANDRMESFVRDEILLIRTTGHYENKSVGDLTISYEEDGRAEFYGRDFYSVRMKVEDKVYGIQKEYPIVFKR
ncbi:MAG: hypothetical protein Q4A75_03930 [Peptostreptococcaceae bacterium]|nr:hypothetical protein [Peptostreptococcaceae bacterium]